MSAKKMNVRAKRYAFQSERAVMTSARGVEIVERLCGAAGASSAPGWPVRLGDTATLRRATTVRDAIATVAGHAAMGMRATSFCAGSGHELARALRTSAAQSLPYVVHHLTGPERQALSDVPVHLVPRTPQEAIDFAVIARWIAERALIPSLISLEAGLAASSRLVDRPTASQLRAILGDPADNISCPDAAQEMVFGSHRRRVPVWLDMARPMGSGLLHDAETEARVRAARHLFGEVSLREAAEAFRVFGEISGRGRSLVGTHRVDDADYLVAAAGSVSARLEAVVDAVRREEGLKVGIISPSMLAPLPERELRDLLAGRRGVTLLEPLETTRQSAFGRAVETYSSSPLYRGRYVRTDLEASYLRAALLNFVEAQLDDYILGLERAPSQIHLPGLERRQQQIRRTYPGVEERILPPVRRTSQQEGDGRAIRLVLSGGADAGEVAALFAAALHETDGRGVATDATAEMQRTEAASAIIHHAQSDADLPVAERDVDLIAASGTLSRGDVAALRPGGRLLVAASNDAAPANLLPARVAEMAAERAAVVLCVDLASIARSLAPEPWDNEWLQVPALLGATAAASDEDEIERLAETTSRRWEQWAEANAAAVEAWRAAFVQGAQDVTEVELDMSSRHEPAPPRSVRREETPDGSLFDLARLWTDVGYPRASGRREEELIDPLLGSGLIPGPSSDFHPSPRTSEMPSLIAERCTGCGTCWSICPEGALPVTVQESETLIGAAMDAAGAAGGELVQLPRIASHLARRIEQLVSDDELNRYLTLSDALEDAFAWVLERMQPDEKVRAALVDEMERVRAEVEDFPLVRTETYFDGEAKPNSVLSIVVDADACTGCGVCVAACPEEALEMRPATEARTQRERTSRRFMERLPDVPRATIDAVLDESEPDTFLSRFLRREVQDTMLGVPGAVPGDGRRTALRLALGAVGGVAHARSERLEQRLGELVERLGAAIEERMDRAVRINDLDAFLHRIVRSEGRPDQILEQALAEPGGRGELFSEVKYLADLRQDLAEVRDRLAGQRYAPLVASIGVDDTSLRTYPANPFSFSWMHHNGEDAHAVAEGLFTGLMQRVGETFGLIRRAEKVLGGGRTDAEVPSPSRWSDLEEAERELCPPLVVLVDDPASVDARLLRADRPLKVIALSDADPIAGPPMTSKVLGLAMQSGVFVAQSSIGAPGRLIMSVEAGMRFAGPALFHLYGPSPERNGFGAALTFEQAERAIHTRTVPSFVVDPTRGEEVSEQLDLSGNLDLGADWMGGDGELLSVADWAVREGRFRSHFRTAPRRSWSPDMVPLVDYLGLSKEERETKTPIVDVQGPDGPVRKVISEKMVSAAAEHRAMWRRLLELAGVRSGLAARATEQAQRAAEAEIERARTAMERERAEEMAAAEAAGSMQAHETLTRQLLTMSGFTPGSGDAERTLRSFLDETDEEV